MSNSNPPSSTSLASIPSMFFRSLNPSSSHSNQPPPTGHRAQNPPDSIFNPSQASIQLQTNPTTSNLLLQSLHPIQRSQSFGHVHHLPNHTSSQSPHHYITHSSKHSVCNTSHNPNLTSNILQSESNQLHPPQHLHLPKPSSTSTSSISSFSSPFSRSEFFKRVHHSSNPNHSLDRDLISTPSFSPSSPINLNPKSPIHLQNPISTTSTSIQSSTTCTASPSSLVSSTTPLSSNPTHSTSSTSGPTNSFTRLAPFSHKPRTLISRSSASTLSIKTSDVHSSSQPHSPTSKKNDSLSSINLSSLGIFSTNPSTTLSSTSGTPTTMTFSNPTTHPKSVLRHMASSSTLASLNTIAGQSNHNFGSKSDPSLGHFSENSGTISLRSGDVWSQIVLRVLPLL